MRTQKERKTTAVVLFIAALFVIPLLAWYFFLNNVGVFRSISLTPGTTATQNFWTNYNGYYSLGIQAERKFPHEELQCLLGIDDSPGLKNCNQTRLKYSWTLSCRGGKEHYSGNSDKIVGGAYANDWMETEFGGFEAKRWERCQLKIAFVDGSNLLSQTNPKLHVYIELF